MPSYYRPCICGCGEEISPEMVACKRAWFSLPLELRRRIWRLYRSNHGSIEHLRAVAQAMDLIREARDK